MLQQLRRRGPYAKTADRRRKILEAAAQVYAECGYYGSSLREVALKAGVSLSNLTHHFATKEEILLATLRQRDADGLNQDAPQSAAEFRTQIIAQARANEELATLIGLYSVLSAEATMQGHPARDYFVERFANLRHEYTETLTLLARQGQLRTGFDPHLTAVSLVALWDGLQLQWLLEPHKIDVVRQLDAFLDAILTE
ncbi:hypothetical protein UM93_05155 [Psychromicrobium lacuslunae]|uniref:HTH tetR-type domain-containing protein n=1 Tax=Psychromicrobium lacuslunae TaxID=1618207 RepID=A0A0D4C2H8_9MICC|nr:hypothetical protein UM93_05155 [Psychromicrobium lacuslunae]